LSRLPPHHIRRPRLTTQCLGASVVVAEAGAGYGKTVFGAELTDIWRSVPIEVVLHEGGVPAELFAARLRAAAAHAGFSAAAAAMSGAGEDAAGAVDALLDALARERCAFVVDDAHHAERDAGRLIERLAERLQADQRLVVLARRLPAGTERLRRADCLQLTAADLALRPDETLRLCRAGFGLQIGPAEAAALERASGGWTAAAALAAARASRTGEDVGALAEAVGDPGRPSSVVAAILSEALAALPAAERSLLAQVGRLPLLDASVVDAATGIEGYFGRALAAGLPFTPGQDGWWDLPGPVSDYLATLGAPEPAVLRRAAVEYERRGQLGAALQLLLACDAAAAAAGLLAEGSPASIEALDMLEFQAVVDRLPAEAVEAHPNLLLHFARSCDTVAIDLRTEVLDRVTAIAAKISDRRLARAIEIERASDLIREGSYARAETAARQVLDASETGEWLTRARAFAALGRTACWRLDPEGRRDPVALREAERHFAQAARLYDQLGMRGARAGLVPYQAIWIEFAGGDARSALKHLEEGLGLVVDRPRKWAYLLLFHAEVSDELGRHDQCEADVREVFRVAGDLGDELLHAYGHWQLAISASYRGDAEETLERVRLTEAHKATWWTVVSDEFLASSADCLDRVGYSELAVEYLRRAQSDPQNGGRLIAMAEGALLARHGDPYLAEERLLAAPGHGIDPREYWRVTLLRAYAAFRRGERDAGALAARAFEEAARLGLAQLPLTKEGAITEELLGLAVETGQPAALALEAAALPVSLAVLGRFALTRGGRGVPMAAGQAAQLLKMVAVSGGRVPADVAIEALWPEAGREAGRNRLRTVLNRQRAEAGDVIVRAGDLLLLAPEVRVDLALFEAEGRRALALGLAEPALAVAVARAAIARYRGDVLPDDPYEQWAELPREHSRRMMLQLLDLCADAAAERGDLDESRRVIELTIDLAPYDDERYLRAAAALLEQGRRGAALTLVRRARAVLAELGLQPPVHLISLEQAIVGEHGALTREELEAAPRRRAGAAAHERRPA
jgi:ATP/maltotriose-dependent transcriptional regulator MalT/DNA-binding SARP family transcriptional activator